MVFKVSEEQSVRSPFPLILALTEQLALILVIYSNKESIGCHWEVGNSFGSEGGMRMRGINQLPHSSTWLYLDTWFFAPRDQWDRSKWWLTPMHPCSWMDPEVATIVPLLREVEDALN